ncbi:MAG TPA: chemotaxis response regulator protein-glutamate methylesterase [Steroidobacteraceae bacterium]|jgi:two-component system chemotaxis response regulator CheB
MIQTAESQRRIKVLVVDDSALVRSLLTKILSADRALEVVGTAPDAFVAREKIKLLNPDVLTLDVEMPRMDGLQFLRNLMRLRPMPVVMCSSLTERGADVTLAALELGAIDFVTKPKVDVAHALEHYAAELIGKLKIAARAQVRPLATPAPKVLPAGAVAPLGLELRFRTTDQIVAIGASTGGTEAIRRVLELLPPNAPGIVVAQHLPKAFSAAFAARLNAGSQLTVQEASDGAVILPGHAYIAPGDRHLQVELDGARYRCRLLDEAPVNRHRPSVDVLFRSMAEQVGQNAIGVLLTGMGADGARGLKEMRDRGAFTIAQDEKTSVVWGMPGAAVALDAVDRILPVEQIAAGLAGSVESREVRQAAGT